MTTPEQKIKDFHERFLRLQSAIKNRNTDNTDNSELLKEMKALVFDTNAFNLAHKRARQLEELNAIEAIK